jgi:hypothetical protein
MELRRAIVKNTAPQFRFSLWDAVSQVPAPLFLDLQVTTAKTLVRRYHNAVFMNHFFMYALFNQIPHKHTVFRKMLYRMLLLS